MYDRFDESLELLSGKQPETRTGGPNHGPMAAEALMALKRGEHAPAWARSYQERLRNVEDSSAGIDTWPSALGKRDLLTAWENFFRTQVQKDGWETAVGQWVPRLVPGCMAVGTHGVIRLGHIVRALAHAQTRARLDELACALAYCASRYNEVLPNPVVTGDRAIEDGLRDLPLLDATANRVGPPPAIVKRLRDLANFTAAVDELAPPDDADRALSQLALAGARVYLANANSHPLVLLHSVTGPSSLQLLLPYVHSAHHGMLFAYMWQAVAAWTSAFALQMPAAGDHNGQTQRPWDSIIDDAVESQDEHSFKLTEACLRQEGLTGHAIFRQVAADWVQRVQNARNWSSEQRVIAGIDARLVS